MAKLNNSMSHRFKDYVLILTGLAVAFFIHSIPLQLYMPLGRYQHYGLSIFALGLGYVLQIVWSWKNLKLWARLGYIGTGLYLTSIGMVLYANPWLDSRVAIMTEEKEDWKILIGWFYTFLAMPLTFIYLGWIKEDHRAQKRRGTDS
jgi:hypothetical protein